MDFPAKPRIVRKFRVPSETEPGTIYIVCLWNDETFTCGDYEGNYGCKAFLFHPRTPCKHIKKVKRFLEKEKYKKYD